MTILELKKRFESGEILSELFGIRSNIYSLGCERITQRQFKCIIKIYTDKYRFEMSHNGLTRHNYFFIKDKS